MKNNSLSVVVPCYNSKKRIVACIDAIKLSLKKLSHKFAVSNNTINYNSKITLKSEIYNQLFQTENKLLQTNEFHSGTYYRLFPILGLEVETPFKSKNNNFDLTYRPHTQIVLTPGFSNTNKISNEDSSNNEFTIQNASSLNRFTGSDKMDNSKRIDYGFDINNENIKINLFQSYEFTNNSNFDAGSDNLSDLLGLLEFRDDENIITNVIDYNFRYDFNEDYLKQQSASITKNANFGDINLAYLDQKSKSNNIIQQDIETLNYNFNSKKFMKFSKINLSGLYDLKKEINTEYSIGYSYYDECFGINLDFKRKSYEEDSLKPQDVLTLMFSFKNIGSYKSTNLAVSEIDKQDIEWEGQEVNNELFETYD